MTKHVIDFKTGGTVSAQYREGGRDIGFLGKQKITRASEVLHDFNTQSFYVVIEEDNEAGEIPQCAKNFPSYETGREFEADWLDQCRMKQVKPLSVLGILLGEELRFVAEL